MTDECGICSTFSGKYVSMYSQYMLINQVVSDISCLIRENS